jgi:hypothetical protein
MYDVCIYLCYFVIVYLRIKMPLRKIKISNDPLVLSFLRFELGDIMGEKKSKRYRLDKRSKEKMKARMNEKVKIQPY